MHRHGLLFGPFEGEACPVTRLLSFGLLRTRPSALLAGHPRGNNIALKSAPRVLTHFAMQWKESSQDGIEVISLSGDIDLQYSPQLRRLLQAKANQRAPALLLDFTEVKYIDSSGLATLVEYYQKSRSYSGQIALAGLTTRVRSVFELVRLSEIFAIYSSVAEAQAGLQPKP